MTKSIIVTFKKDATDEEMQKVKDQVTAVGGTIKDVFTIFKGFSADLPEIYPQTLFTDPQVESVEDDGVVTTQ